MASHSKEDIEREQSQRIFWVIQTVFSLVLTRSFFEYKDCLLDPFSPDKYLTAFGLVLVYFTTLWSWIDFSYTSILSPYRFQRSAFEKLRFISDIAIVTCYAVLLFSLSGLQTNQSCDIGRFLMLFVIVFFLYFVSGVLRVVQFGRKASRLGLIFSFVLLYAALYTSYRFSVDRFENREMVNVVAIGAGAFLMLLYRCVRSSFASRKVWLGIDVDGVLGNQIVPLLPMINKQYGADLKYEDIVEWDMKIGDSDIATIIRSEQKHRRYLEKMPVHQNGKEM